MNAAPLILAVVALVLAVRRFIMADDNGDSVTTEQGHRRYWDDD